MDEYERYDGSDFRANTSGLYEENPRQTLGQLSDPSFETRTSPEPQKVKPKLDQFSDLPQNSQSFLGDDPNRFYC